VSPSKLPRKASVLDARRWGLCQVIWFCSILALISALASVVIGSLTGGAEEIFVALIISAAFFRLFGSIALAFVALGSIADMLRVIGGRASGPSNPEIGGVSDERLVEPA
jgi:hypothetical protein